MRRKALSSDGSAGDEEPLVIYTINWRRLELLMPLDLTRARLLAVFRVWNCDVGAGILLAKPVISVWKRRTYREIPPRPDLPVINLSQASAHSRTTSVAYLEIILAGPCMARGKGNLLLVLALSRESKLVFWLSVGDLVDPEPLIRGPQKARQMSLNILNVVKSRRQWVIDVYDDDLPIRFFFIKQSHDA